MWNEKQKNWTAHHYVMAEMNKTYHKLLKPYYSIGRVECIFISLLKSAAFLLQISEYNLKPP